MGYTHLQAPFAGDAVLHLQALMAKFWHRLFRRLCNWVYFARVTLIHPERLPKNGPVLFLGLHRNGAVDGFVYDSVLGHPTFLISTQLRKKHLGRLFFEGIEVVRPKDEGDRSLNLEAMKKCLDHLRVGGRLFILPEGTSALGPRHLPFKSGAAQLTLDYLANGGTIQVIPLGIHYECPWGFQSKVEVVVGRPIATALPAALSPLGKLKELKRRMQCALEEVGINVASDEYQETIQRLAYVSTLATRRSYFKSLKALELSIPQPILADWTKLEPELKGRKLLCHQGVPLFPMGSRVVYLMALMIGGPLALAGIAVNLPPFLLGWWAGKKYPDDRNVISLWRILVAIPVLILWCIALGLTAIVFGKLVWLPVYLAVSCLGLKSYYRVKKLAVAVHNGLRHPELRSRMLAFRETVLRSLPDETA